LFVLFVYNIFIFELHEEQQDAKMEKKVIANIKKFKMLMIEYHIMFPLDSL